MDTKFNMNSLSSALQVYVKPMFQDAKQDEFNRLIVELECKLLLDCSDYEKFDEIFPRKFKNIMQTLTDTLRLCQAIIEIAGSANKDVPIEAFSRWISYAIQSENIPTAQKLQELLNPYLEVNAKSFSNDTSSVQRNVCIVLYIMAAHLNHTRKDKLFSRNVAQFLIKIIIECDKTTTMLYALYSLRMFLTAPSIKEQFQENDNLCEILKSFGKGVNLYTLELFNQCKLDYTRFQIGFLSRRCVELIEGGDGTNSELSEIQSKSSFNSDDCSVGTDLSPNHLFIGGNSLGRARCSYPVTCGIFYYEVTVLASGPIRIGWGTKEAKFVSLFDWDDKEETNSTCFVSHYEHIFHREWYNRRLNIYKSKPGDVIGCLIDVNIRFNELFQNGKSLICTLYNSIYPGKPCFASVTLEMFQQCYANFGQAPFKYPPTGSYRTFHGSITKYINDNLCPFCNVKPALVPFGNCDHWKICVDCVAKLSKCPTCEK